jgi:glycosyltransferase involved in cell wall biosynthesis
VALVHEWLCQWGGSESVVESFTRLFPGAPVHVSVSHPDARCRAVFDALDVRTSRLQRIPGGPAHHRWLLPLMPEAFARMDVGPADLVLSSSHAFAKSVRVPQGATHVCYCHTPPRYLWDLARLYNPGWKGALRRPLIARLRKKDREGARGVDHFIANSGHVAERIERTYGRRATVIYPPVDVDRFALTTREPESYFLAGGRMVGYKRLDVAVQAAAEAGFSLKVFGSGPELRRLKAMAGPTVEFVEGQISDARLLDLMEGARAFLFPGQEDFGILPVEVQAVGRPVIAWDHGGARETVVDGRTGVLYPDPSPAGLVAGIERFEMGRFTPTACRENAERFSRERFEREIAAEIARVCTSGKPHPASPRVSAS